MGLMPRIMRGALWRKPMLPDNDTNVVVVPPLTAISGGVCWLPSEQVLLLAVTLPRMSGAQRKAAVAFAVEDQIARPLDEVHVVLGPALPDGRWLVAVVARDVLASRQAGAPGMRILPEAMALPVPDAGQWSARAVQDRVILRLPDGTGMAVAAPMLPALHALAGAPGIVLYGGDLPDGMTAVAEAPLPPITGAAGFDLRNFGTGAGILTPTLRRVGIVLLLAALAHLGLVVAERVTLTQQLATAQANLRAALTTAGQAANVDLDTGVARVLAGSQPEASAGFLPLISAVFAGIEPLSGRVFVRDLQYEAAGSTLTLTLEAPDLTTLQEVEVALAEAQLQVTAGAATTAGGLAEQQLILRGATP